MLVAIIDYGSGNLRSAEKAFQRASLETGLTAKISVTADADLVAKADRIVLPGVGAYADCRRGLDAVPGMVEALHETVISKARPFLGICVGMQLMSSRGLEKETTLGLDWIAGDVVPMQPADKSLRIPQIGWNTLEANSNHALLKDIPLGENGWHAYFVHSYHLEVSKPDQLIATTGYGMAVTAMVGRGNMVGTQFHPEKSQKLGLKLISNFLGWRV
jgi:imidazole glycerol-phosphate synthase subunit HisH